MKNLRKYKKLGSNNEDLHNQQNNEIDAMINLKEWLKVYFHRSRMPRVFEISKFFIEILSK